MSPNLKTFLKVLLSVLLAVVIVYFVFKKVDLEEFVAQAKTVNYSWVLLSMGISFFSYFLRAYRWRLQLEPLGYAPSTYRMFLAIMSGYLANLVIPRLGEVTRCGVLLKSNNVPVSTSFGTVITERIVDMLALAVIFLITLFLQSDQLVQFIDQTVDLNLNWYLIAGIGLGVAGLGSFIFFKFIYPSETKIGAFSRNLVEGLISLRNVKITSFTVITILIWVIYFFTSYVVIFAMKETSHLGWEVGFSILTAGVVAFVLPVQSGFGTFHALVSTMLILYGVDQTAGLFYATLLHTSQLIAIIIFGSVAVILSIFVKTNAEQRKSTD
ncbi:MAG: lysylphosphatidylglycerol synthase transmembrane domain-containing protein [Cyclobacteriaceae bacterium]